MRLSKISEVKGMKALQLLRLNRLVDAKGWSASTFSPFHKMDPVALISQVIDQLDNDKQISLYLNLLEEFLVIKDYRQPAIELLTKVVDAYPNDIEFVFAEVVDETDDTKSAAVLNYEIKSTSNVFSATRNFQFLNDPRADGFQSSTGIKVLVDDFIGTGDQFCEMVDKLNYENLNSTAHIVLCIAIQREAFERLESLGYRVFSLYVRSPVLNKLSQRDDIQFDPYEVNFDIADKIPVHALQALGYGNSEAVVSMKRTPDNTLPIFTKNGVRTKWQAIFPR